MDYISPEEFRHSYTPKLGRDAVYSALKSKRIRSIRLNRNFRIPREEVEDWPAREMGVQK